MLSARHVPCLIDFPATGDPDLVPALHDVIAVGFPRHVVPDRVRSIEIRWNGRLRSTVGRVLWGPDSAIIEVSPSYHEAHPDELVETLAHEYAHVLRPDDHHGPRWRCAFRDALTRLEIPAPSRLTRARHPAPHRGRYVWHCNLCDSIVGQRPTRSATEVSVRTTCCDAPVTVRDNVTGHIAPKRRHVVGCLRCRVRHRAYDVRDTAERFARRHRCQCGGTLTVMSRPVA